MNSALPIGRLTVHQTEIGFVDKSGGLQGVITALPGEVFLRNPAQLIVDEGNQRVSGR